MQKSDKTILEHIKIPVYIEEENGIERFCEPVSTGIPFPKGKIFRTSDIYVINQDEEHIPFAASILDTWSDRSMKWVLFDFQVSMKPHTETFLTIHCKESENHYCSSMAINIEENNNEFIVRNNKAEFYLDKKVFRPFKKVIIHGSDIISKDQSQTVLTDGDGVLWTPVIDTSLVESNNGMKAVILCDGHFSKEVGANGLLFQSRVFFFAEHSFVKIEFTVWNPNAAVHPGGFWDLGDPVSIFFNDLSFNVKLNTEKPLTTQWKAENEQPATSNEQPATSNLLIYQDSSGGENWKSRNHVNHLGKIPLSFRGYRVYQSDKTIDEGLRATPLMAVTDGENSIAGTLHHFWQNFPAAIESYDHCLRISPFPTHFKDLFEIQGGEKKTHRIYLDFCDSKSCMQSLAWVHQPLFMQSPPDWNCSTGALPYLISREDIPDKSPYKELFEFTEVGIKGNNTFFDRREIIDEYGWRNFGDVYADHENRFYTGEKPIISHYNNQYDLINSFLFQYIRTGENDWFKLSTELAWHVMDIDIYHTDNDRYEFNKGMLWHTDHFATAATGTHRGFSKQIKLEQKNTEKKDDPASSYAHYGGGLSFQHIYSHGLLNYYYLTGDHRAKESAIGLAEYVSNGINGPKRVKAIVKEIVKNTVKWGKQYLNQKTILPYGFTDGPGRGSGNALSVLLDGFMLTKESEYLSKADYLIKACVHPKDDVEKRQFDDVNMRWAYTIFLQALGKYLDMKAESQNYDYMFFYARESLLHYAKWMLANEVPILSLSDSFDFPNFSTRAANDIRKASLLMIASKYAHENDVKEFQDKAIYFFKESADALLSFETSELTRPMAIIIQNMNIPLYFIKYPRNEYKQTGTVHDFGTPNDEGTIKNIVAKNYKLLLKIFQ